MPIPRNIEEHIDEYNRSYEQGNENWFDHFSEDATVYAIGEVKPIVGRSSYREVFANLLPRQRQVEVLSRDMQVTDTTAVVMQLLRVTQDGVTTTFRESTIWNQEDDEWKIVHLNTSLAADPVPENLTEFAQDADSIRVLGSRLATASSQVGIAQ